MVRSVLFLLAAFAALAAPAAAIAQYPTNAQVLEELNLARTRPLEYAQILREYRRYFKGDIVYDPAKELPVRSKEGVAVVDEAIAFLERQQPLAPLFPSPILTGAASDHVNEQGPMGTFGHTSADGSNPDDRLVRRGGGRNIGETIAYGQISSARDLVIQLIVDDGVPDRGHRLIIFQDRMRFAGSACGFHQQLSVMCVTDYSQWVDGRYAPPPPQPVPQAQPQPQLESGPTG